MEEKNWAKVNKNTNIVENVEVATEDWVEKWKIENPESEYVYILDKEIKATMQGTYDFENKVFIDIQPYDSWILNENTFQWESPVPYPDYNKEYVWNDKKGKWTLSISDEYCSKFSDNIVRQDFYETSKKSYT